MVLLVQVFLVWLFQGLVVALVVFDYSSTREDNSSCLETSMVGLIGLLGTSMVPS